MRTATDVAATTREAFLTLMVRTRKVGRGFDVPARAPTTRQLHLQRRRKPVLFASLRRLLVAQQGDDDVLRNLLLLLSGFVRRDKS